MQALDIIFLVLVGLLALRGFLKGFTGELFSVASFVLAAIASVLLFKNGAFFIRSRYLQMKILPEVLAFLIIFIAVFVLGKITGRIVKDIITRTRLETPDKVLGIILGLVEGFAIVVISLFILTIQPLFDPVALLNQSFIAQFLLPLVRAFHV